MKLFKTQSIKETLKDNVYIIVENGISKLVQFDNKGKYISTIEDLNLPEGKYALDKNLFFKAIKVLKKDFSIRATEKHIIFESTETTIDVPLVEFNLDDTSFEEYDFKDLPENFLRIFKKASSMVALENAVLSRPVIKGVHIQKGIAHATDERVAYEGKFNGELDINLVLPADLLSVVPNPTQYTVANQNIVLKDARGIAIIKTLDDAYPDISGFFIEEPKDQVGNIVGDGAYKDLHDALRDASDLGHKEIILDPKCLVIGDKDDSTPEAVIPDYKRAINITIPNQARFYIPNLFKGLINDRVYCAGNNEPLFSFRDDEKTLVLPMPNRKQKKNSL